MPRRGRGRGNQRFGHLGPYPDFSPNCGPPGPYPDFSPNCGPPGPYLDFTPNYGPPGHYNATFQPYGYFPNNMSIQNMVPPQGSPYQPGLSGVAGPFPPSPFHVMGFPTPMVPLGTSTYPSNINFPMGYVSHHVPPVGGTLLSNYNYNHPMGFAVPSEDSAMIVGTPVKVLPGPGPQPPGKSAVLIEDCATTVATLMNGSPGSQPPEKTAVLSEACTTIVATPMKRSLESEPPQKTAALGKDCGITAAAMKGSPKPHHPLPVPSPPLPSEDGLDSRASPSAQEAVSELGDISDEDEESDETVLTVGDPNMCGMYLPGKHVPDDVEDKQTFREQKQVKPGKVATRTTATKTKEKTVKSKAASEKRGGALTKTYLAKLRKVAQEQSGILSQQPQEKKATTRRSMRSASLASIDKDKCPICLLEVRWEYICEQCGQKFCWTCFDEWLEHAGTCPLCRYDTDLAIVPHEAQ